LRRFFSAGHNGRLLVVLPHLSGSALFAANAALQAAGAQIGALMRAMSTQRQVSDHECAKKLPTP
jgi:hypothetical protein